MITYDTENLFFTADNHFGHENIIKFCHRPFGSAEEMDNEMVARWNSTVPVDGIVYHLGDFSLSGDFKYVYSMFSRLNGRIKFIAIPWHHDKRWLSGLLEHDVKIRSASSEPVEFLPPLHVIYINDPDGGSRPLPITLSHYPMVEWEASHHGSWHLHGHTHGDYEDSYGRKLLDVGVDSNNFAPVSFGEVSEYMGGKYMMPKFKKG